MANSTLIKPRTIAPGTNPEPGAGKEALGEDMSNFEFSNSSPYYVYVRFDWQEHLVSADPDVLIKPWSNQHYTYRPGTKRLCYQAAADLPASANPADTSPTFWFMASDQTLAPSTPSYQSVGVESAPPTAITGGVTADVSRIIDNDFVTVRNTLLAQLAADTQPRITIRNDGKIRVGDGIAVPLDVYEIIAPGQIRIIRELLLTELPTVPMGAANKEYVDSRITTLIANQKPAADAPDTWPIGLARMRVTSTAVGYPATMPGYVLSFGAGIFSSQIFIANDRKELFMRYAISDAAWSTWERIITQTSFDSGISTHSTDATAHATAINDAIIARTFVDPVLPSGFTDTTNLRIAQAASGLVTVMGRVRADVAKPVDSVICAVAVAYRPNRSVTFPCARFPAGLGGPGFEQIMPVYYDTGTFQLRLGDAMAADAKVDLSPLSWMP